ncbi:hypothetical protein PQX77_017046 [Marasmius sp. AFHP31]|nr:hypothetical protein PQX77_017046 [Marasmius sp. AFHP31]
MCPSFTFTSRLASYSKSSFYSAQSFAQSSAANRRNLAEKAGCPLKPTDEAAKAVVCKIEAKVSKTFREKVSKIWIPPNEIARPIPGQGNDPATLAKQEERIKNAKMDPANTLRFSVLDKDAPKETRDKIGSQFMIPVGALENFVVRQCVPVSAGRPSDAPSFAEFNYRKVDLDWFVVGDPFSSTGSGRSSADITDVRNKDKPA